MSFAQVQLIGNVGRDPEMNYTPDGAAVTKFSIAVSEKVKQGGKETESTTWYTCSAWRALGETINQHVTKGSQLFVQGKLTPRQYVSKEGKPGISLDVTVDKFAFTGSKPANGGSQRQYNDPLAPGYAEDDEHPF